MNNRFTVKDFFYMLIGIIVCMLLFFNMLKTDREVEALEHVNSTLKDQSQTLGTLKTAIEGINDLKIDASTIGSISTHEQHVPSTTKPQTSADVPVDTSGPINVAKLPSYEPGYDIRFSGASSSVNRYGKPQQWQTAPDDELPEDFAPGGTLVSIWNSEPQTLTPFVARDRYSKDVQREVMEWLIWEDVDAPFHYRPGLARSWEVSDDGMVITFHLFENATWSDGVSITSDDVVFTFDLVMNPAVDAPIQRSYIEDNISNYERLDTHTVRFTMRQQYFDAVGVCGNLLMILPRHVYGNFSPDEYNEKIREVCVGSGPWKIEEWDVGRELVLVRNENYWGPKPAIERHVIRFVENEKAGMQEFWAGNADFVWVLPPQWDQYAESDKLAERGHALEFYTPLGGYAYIGYNLRLPKFSDKRTRQALTMLIDRQEMIDTLRFGLGRIATGPFYFEADQYDKSVEPWPYDPARARHLLAEVGWADSDRDGILDMDLNGDGIREPFEIVFRLPTSTQAEQYQRFVQGAFRQAGIKVNLDQQEWSVFEEKLTERDFDMVMLAWTSNPEGDPKQIWHSSEAENRGSNFVGFVNERADELIDTGRTTMVYAKRMEIWHEFHRLVNEEQPYTFLMARPRMRFYDKRLAGVIPHGLRLYHSEWYIPQALQTR